MPVRIAAESESFADRVRRTCGAPVTAERVSTLQVNITRKCNLACRHCHVQAGPGRTEQMSAGTLYKCLALAEKHPEITAIDITGGAPEMNPHLENFLSRASKLGKRLITRSNLTILLEPAYRNFPAVYARNRVELVASLPGLCPEKTDRQRGPRSFERITAALKTLNALGYGKAGSGLVLNIAHNPVGAFLPGSQAELERRYRTELGSMGIGFNNLFCLTNAPVGRYLDYLLDSGNFTDYMTELSSAYNPAAVKNVMCRSMISVGWDGKLYDCDFNQMLDLPIAGAGGTLDGFDMAFLSGRAARVDDHCYACAAGAGSSCQGCVENKTLH